MAVVKKQFRGIYASVGIAALYLPTKSMQCEAKDYTKSP
jgi:uncharacterized membrane protein YuzA (DUF378 family)